MRFLCLYKPVAPEGAIPNPHDMNEMGKFVEECIQAGVLRATEGCQPSAKGARIRLLKDKFTVIDGPFTESKELIAGFALLETKTKEEAIEYSKRFLKVAGDGETEIRLVYEPSDFGQENDPRCPGISADRTTQHVDLI